MDTFGSWLRSALDARGWNQSDLARAMTTRPSVISKWVNGHQKPEVEQCNRMAHALRLPPVHVYHLAGHEWLNHDVPMEDEPLYGEINAILRDIPRHHLRTIAVMLRALADDEQKGG